METMDLYTAVAHFAALTHTFSEADLDQNWQWRAHNEGVRFAFLGTIQELRELAAQLAQQRQADGPPISMAQRVLGQYTAAYRDFQAIMLGVSQSDYEQEPAVAEWPLRLVVGHMFRTQSAFFTLVHYGLARQRTEEERPLRLPPGETDRVVMPQAEFVDLLENQSMAAMLAAFDALHRRTLAEFAAMTDEESLGPSVWWEDEPYSLAYRLHRFDAHLRQHTIQAEKTLEQIGRPVGEAKKLLRLMYAALAETETAVLGAPDLGLAAQQALAKSILARATEVLQVAADYRAMSTAVTQGNRQEVDALLAANPNLANALTPQRLPILFAALYNGQTDLANQLVAAGAELDVFSATAVGRLDVVEKEFADYPQAINLYSRDGFTPLQFACFFGQEATALWLMDHGADIHAAAKNPLRIQPIHAAAANGSMTVLRALLERGADANARQQQDFTPMHTAADRDDVAMAELLLAFGADAHAENSEHETPLALAKTRGKQQMAAFLETQKP